MYFLTSHFFKNGVKMEVLAIASAWEAGWLILAGHPEVFRNKVGEIMTFRYIF